MHCEFLSLEKRSYQLAASLGPPPPLRTPLVRVHERAGREWSGCLTFSVQIDGWKRYLAANAPTLSASSKVDGQRDVAALPSPHSYRSVGKRPLSIELPPRQELVF